MAKWGHSKPSVSVPLIVAGPGVRGGVETTALTAIHDLAATLLTYANVSLIAAMDSRSLRPVLEGREITHREYVISALANWRMIWDGRFKLVRVADDPPLLFGLVNDPCEDHDIAAAVPEECDRLARAFADAEVT